MIAAREKERLARKVPRHGQPRSNKKPRIDDSVRTEPTIESVDDEYLPDDEMIASTGQAEPQDGISAEVRALMSQCVAGLQLS
jgi:hypothetical protein